MGDNGGVEHIYRETCTKLHYIVSEDGSKSYIVYPNTVGQYTGKKDKNNKEIKSIYDDDIIKYDIEFEIFDGDYNQYGLVGVIKYNEKTCSYEVFENDDNYSVSLLKNIEVIGNIHDNPELIGG